MFREMLLIHRNQIVFPTDAACLAFQGSVATNGLRESLYSRGKNIGRQS